MNQWNRQVEIFCSFFFVVLIAVAVLIALTRCATGPSGDAPEVSASWTEPATTDDSNEFEGEE